MTAVIALLRGLPSDTDFMSHWLASLEIASDGVLPDDTRTAEQIHLDDLVSEYQLWGPQNKVLAMVGNAVHLNTVVTGRIGEKAAKDMPMLGPRAWYEDSPSKVSRADSVAGFFQAVTGAPLPKQ